MKVDVEGETNMLEIGLCSIKLQVFGAIDKPSAIFYDLLQTYPRPLGSTNCSFRPRCIDHLIALASILVNLLYTSRAYFRRELPE